MKKILLSCIAVLTTGLIAAGCEKTYTVEEFKKNDKLLKEWMAKCGGFVKSKNCQNVYQAEHEKFLGEKPVNTDPGHGF
ncbi:EexN family lipoprotein [Bartonella schoenbuchensis]|uniref:Lipoprotein n=1 Tax=Bartonella schoenbuchensis m07a TaxID=1094496 RepID=N6UCX6_9HYPH|nr:EexN family lipoprotein [Bartonella schoenbuchensis]ENN90464.1 hypothetical protein m07a_pML00540 [Bartonella schoenbuchensis m07a]